MQFKILSTRVLVSAVLAFAILAGVVVLYEVVQGTQQAVIGETSSVMQKVSIVPGLPMRLKIPKIKLDSEVEYVGLTLNGEMATPKNISNVGWYEPGVRPGDVGSAVIAGHYGWEDGKASAFDELHKLRVGDKIYVEDDVGTVTTFVIRANRRYDPKEDAGEVFNSKDGKAHLNLISCEGDWDESSQSYSKRLVVFADRE